MKKTVNQVFDAKQIQMVTKKFVENITNTKLKKLIKKKTRDVNHIKNHLLQNETMLDVFKKELVERNILK